MVKVVGRTRDLSREERARRKAEIQRVSQQTQQKTRLQQLEQQRQEALERLRKKQGEVLQAENRVEELKRQSNFKQPNDDPLVRQAFNEAKRQQEELRREKRQFQESKDLVNVELGRTTIKEKQLRKEQKKGFKTITATLETGLLGGSKETIKENGRIKSIVVKKPKKVKSKDIRKELNTQLRKPSKTLTISKVKSLSKKISENVEKDLAKILTKQQQGVANKVLTGQTVTPEEIKQYQDIVIKEGERLEKEQLTLLKNAPKNIGLGIYEVGKEVVVLAKDSIVGSFNYGKSLRKRFEAGENNPLKNDIIKLGKGTVSVGTFIKENPRESIAIVGLYSTQVGGEVKKAFVENPVKTLTKAVVYLFPGTVLKTGSKGISLGVKGTKAGVIKGVSSIRLISLNKKLEPVKKLAGLTPKQTLSLNKAIVKASKISNKAKRDTIIKNSLKKILKERGITPKRAANIDQLITQVKASKVQKIKIKKKTLPKKKKSSEKIKKIDIKTGKVSKIKKEPTKKPRKKPVRVKRVKVKGTKAKKVTKKEFEKITKTKKEAKTKSKSKKIDVRKKSKKLLKEKLKKQGVVKQGDTTFIDLNAVKRIENSKVAVKPITKKGLLGNKKAQVRFNRQVNSQVQVHKKTITKAKKTLKDIKKSKTPNKAKLNKTKLELAKSKKALQRILKLIKANKEIIVRLPLLVALITSLIATIKAQEKAIAQTPVQDQPQKPDTKPKFDPAQKPKITPAQKTGQGSSQTPKKISKTETPPRFKTPRKPKTTKKLPKRIKLKLPKLTFNTKLPKGQRLKFDALYKEKGKIKRLKIGLPLRKAQRRIGNLADTTTQRSVQLVISGITKAKDLKDKPKVISKFRAKKSKDKTVLNLVEKSKNAIDSKGEKKGLSISRKLASQKKKTKTKTVKTKKKPQIKSKSKTSKALKGKSTPKKKKTSKKSSKKKK